jgi:hypothetical protein
MVLEELQLPYHIQYKELAETKTEDYLQINPNGRLPAIKDPNSGLTLWEVSAVPGAIYAQDLRLPTYSLAPSFSTSLTGTTQKERSRTTTFPRST